MTSCLLSGVIDTGGYISGYDDGLISLLDEILKRIDSLYCLENADNKLINIERFLYDDLIKLLKSCGRYVDIRHIDSFNEYISSITEGLYDIKPVEIPVPGRKKLVLLFGKVYSDGGSKSYSGALGIENNGFDLLVNNYKNEIDQSRKKLVMFDDYIFEKIKTLGTSFNCVNIIKFGGGLNKDHLPISLFFSGGVHEKLSSLSNTYLFTNIYTKRYFIISENLGRKFIRGYNDRMMLDRDVISKILILWLWGHDTGHFVVGDNFTEDIFPDNKYIYEVFHELWSDLFSIYLLKELSEDFLDVDKEQVFIIFLCEMLRYIRKGGFMHYPDSVSALIMYRLMVMHNIIEIDYASLVIYVDFAKFNKAIDKLMTELSELFNEVSTIAFKDYLGNTGLEYDLSNADKLMDFDIRSFEIPSYISILR